MANLLIKILAISGMCLVGVGTVLLWMGSPSGYSPSGLLNKELLDKLQKNNRRMRVKQWMAIVLITIGTLLQFPAVLLG